MSNTAPLFIAHRINTVTELRSVPEHCGIELDLRDKDNDIILGHDPFGTGERFEDFLREYRHKTLILNIKSERIEFRVRELLKTCSITDYFFLDSSFPMIYLLSAQGEKNIALRFSEFEGLDTLRAMQGRVRWTWIDCFSRFPLDQKTYAELKRCGYRICIVSPELQGRPEKLAEYRDFMKQENILPDAICCRTNVIPQWKEVFA